MVPKTNRLDGFFALALGPGVVRIDVLFSCPDKSAPEGTASFRVLTLDGNIAPAKADQMLREVQAEGDHPQAWRTTWENGDQQTVLLAKLEPANKDAAIREANQLIRNCLDEPEIH
jgi:hypothetical protein